MRDAADRHLRLFAASATWTWTSLFSSMALVASAISPEAMAVDYPTSITLRAGVLDAAPFAVIDYDDNGNPNKYSGLEIDLLEQLQIYAAEDGVDLKFELSPSPRQYGASFDLVANDCNTTATADATSKEDCEKYDIIVAAFYSNPARAIRAHLTPPWLRSGMSTIGRAGNDHITLAQASHWGTSVCLVDGTWLSEVVTELHSGVVPHSCPSVTKCLEELKAGKCELFVDDELELRYHSLHDPLLEMTREQFGHKYFVWAMKYELDPTVRFLIDKWIYAGVANGALDTLYNKYFAMVICPIGRAGKNCTLPCDSTHGVSDPRLGTCVCISLKWTGGDCSIEVQEDLNPYPVWEVYLCYLYFSINAAACILCACWLYWNRNVRQVQVWQPFFLNLVLFGCFLSSLSIIATEQESATDGGVVACMVFPWLLSLGFSITFGTLFAKIRRVYQLFQAAASATRVTVTVKDTLMIICGITSVDVMICAVWTVIDPLHWTRVVSSEDRFGEPLSSVGYCTSKHWEIFVSVIGVWHMFLMGVASYMCYLSRNICTQFSEGKYLSLVVFSNFQILLICTPLLFLLSEDTGASLFLRATVIWINDFVVIVIIFGSLIYSVHFTEDDVNLTSAVRQYVTGSAVTGSAAMESSAASKPPSRSDSGP